MQGRLVLSRPAQRTQLNSLSTYRAPRVQSEPTREQVPCCGIHHLLQGSALMCVLRCGRCEGTARDVGDVKEQREIVEWWSTCMTTMLPTAAAACAALGEGGSPCGFMRSHLPLLTSMMCTSLVAPASLMPAWHLLYQETWHALRSSCGKLKTRASCPGSWGSLQGREHPTEIKCTIKKYYLAT